MSTPPTRLWFPDTSSLLTMAVHPDIHAAVLAEMGADPVVVIDVVVDELHLRKRRRSTAELAKSALAALPATWSVLDTSSHAELEDIRQAQSDVADGRALADDEQHWAESVVIALGRRSAATASTTAKLLLSEDFDARRVASTVRLMRGASVHRVLHDHVHAGRMSAEAAAALAAEIRDAGRGPDVTAEEFRAPVQRGLRRVGMP